MPYLAVWLLLYRYLTLVAHNFAGVVLDMQWKRLKDLKGNNQLY